MTVRAFAPGRVNAMGDHIDYLGGQVLPLALPLGTQVELDWIEGDQHQVHSDSHGHASFSVDQTPQASGAWYDYCVGALKCLPRAVSVQIHSDLPQGTGLSSSASLLVALISARNALTGVTASPLDVALEARRIEVEHIGLNCGIMDQYASALGQEGHALLLDCQAMTHQPVAFQLGSAQLWAVDSKAPRKLAGGVYNQRVAECAEIQALAGSQDFFSVSLDLPEPLAARLRHIQSEQQRVAATAQVASKGDVHRWGQLMNESHRSLSADYQVAGPALDQLQQSQASAPGCYGARMTGGGFGGCVIALLEASELEQIQAKVAQDYGEVQWIPCQPSDGARLL